jgi:hypothetical protein
MPTSTTPHLTAIQVASIATSAFTEFNRSSMHYTSDAPEYRPSAQAWWVHFSNDSLDSDVTVIVRDRNGSTCIQTTVVQRPCT